MLPEKKNHKKNSKPLKTEISIIFSHLVPGHIA